MENNKVAFCDTIISALDMATLSSIIDTLQAKLDGTAQMQVTTPAYLVPQGYAALAHPAYNTVESCIARLDKRLRIKYRVLHTTQATPALTDMLLEQLDAMNGHSVDGSSVASSVALIAAYANQLNV